MWLFHFIVISVVFCLIKADDEEVERSQSASVEGMVNLLQLEADLIENLSSYGDELEEKLKIVRTGVERMRAESDKAISQQEEYVSNPLNAFSLIRRMHDDWSEWLAFMENSEGWSQASYLNQHIAYLPNENDLEETCEAIYRLLSVYNLKAMDMATGLLNGKQYNASLNAVETYTLGQYFDKHQNYQLAMEWFTETNKWLFQPGELHTSERLNMLHMFASAFVDLSESLEYIIQ